jgi:hypothetical protein
MPPAIAAALEMNWRRVCMKCSPNGLWKEDIIKTILIADRHEADRGEREKPGLRIDNEQWRGVAVQKKQAPNSKSCTSVSDNRLSVGSRSVLFLPRIVWHARGQN